MAEDHKFKFEDGKFINRVSGEAIPDDEPVIIFRARDAYSVQVLAYYAGLVQDAHHQKAVDQALDRFLVYRRDNPDKIKEPGITHDIKLEDD